MTHDQDLWILDSNTCKTQDFGYRSQGAKVTPNLKNVATLPCDLSLITIHVSDCHSCLTLAFDVW